MVKECLNEIKATKKFYNLILIFIIFLALIFFFNFLDIIFCCSLARYKFMLHFRGIRQCNVDVCEARENPDERFWL